MYNPLDPESEDSEETPPDEAPTVPETSIPEVPETELERPDVPSPSVPDLESQAEDVNPKFRAVFWKLILIFDLAVFATTAGLLLIYVDGRVIFGGQLLIGGVVGLAYTLVLVARWKGKLDSGEFTVVSNDDREGETDATAPTDDDSPVSSQEDK